MGNNKSYIPAPPEPHKLKHLEMDLQLLGYPSNHIGTHLEIEHSGKPFDVKALDRISKKHGLEALTKAEYDKVSMPKDEFIEEHKNLIGILETGTKKERKAEAKDQKKELEEKCPKCLEKICKCELAKSFLQVDGTTKTDSTAHNTAAGEIPTEVWNWGVHNLVPMKKDAKETIPFSWQHGEEAKSVIVKIRKHEEDLYSGWIEKDGVKIHEFDHLTMPELLSQLRSKTEFYNEKPVPPPADNIPTENSTVDSKIKELKDKLDGLKADVAEVKKDLYAGPVEPSGSEVIEGKDLVGGMINPEKTCEACENPVESCSCYEGMPKPRVEFDGKKVTIFFKSEWGAEDRENFIDDLKARAGKVLVRKSLERARKIVGR